MRDLLYSLRVMHGRLHDWRKNELPQYIERLKKPTAVYLLMTPEHGNLGDHAITQSEIEILNELKQPYIEVSGWELRRWQKRNCLNVMNGRTILVNGGGNLGTLWPDVENIIQRIIISNPKSRILILPNTVFYDEGEAGKKALYKSIEVYNSHQNLTFYARESESYKLMKSAYNNVKLVPDMVLRMNKCQPVSNRKGCILCLRSDREKTRTEAQEKELRNQVSSIFGEDILEIDMVQGDHIEIEDRDSALEKQYDAFRHAELVVTDRLHGMIFSAITGTPCIVIDSKSPKVKGCYEWIKDLDYIEFCNDVSRISDIYSKLSKKSNQYNNDHLMPLFNQLKADIQEAAKANKL